MLELDVSLTSSKILSSGRKYFGFSPEKWSVYQVVTMPIFFIFLLSPFLVQNLTVSQNSLLGHRGKICGGIEVFEREVYYFLSFHPFGVDAVKPFQMDNLRTKRSVESISVKTKLYLLTDQNGRQPPNLQLLSSRLLILTPTAVVLFLQIFLGGEGFETVVQIYWFRVQFSASSHRFVFSPQLFPAGLVAQM